MNMLLIAQHTLFRDGLKLLLKNSNLLDLCEEAENLKSALVILNAKKFDLIFLDVKLKDAMGLDSLRSIKKITPTTPIIAVSDNADLQLAKQAMVLGASACVSKTSPYKELLKAIHAVRNGQRFLSLELIEQTAQPTGKNWGSSDLSVVSSLSDRQKEVLRHIAKGASNKGISIEMNISQNTVKAHLATIFKVLGVHNRTEAFYFAARAGMPLDD